jgi:DNA-binding NarL/FixJ family response regulator
MKLLARYVLFYCDDCDLLTPAIQAFASIHKYHTVLTSSDEADFIDKLNTYPPELVLVYLNDPAKDYLSLVKTIRESASLSRVPMLIYKTLPDADELISVFQKLKKFDD